MNRPHVAQLAGVVAIALGASAARADADAPAAAPAPEPAPAAAATPAPEPAPTPSGPKIAYKTGVEVNITSTDPATEIYLAHGDVPIDTMPDPYERIGLAPIKIKLAAGTYSIETASPTQSTGHERFVVEQGKPLHIEIRAGNASVKGIGAVLAGLGVVSIVLGVVAIVSFGPNEQGSYDRWGIGLPLVIAGAAGCGVGVGMTALGATGVHVERQPRPAALVPTVRFAF